MLLTAHALRDISFGKLMEVYLEGNQENGAELAPDEPVDRQIMQAEQAFYAYLNDSFFRTPGALYEIWPENGKYISALRLEPYRDGLLLEALETRPDSRRQGYAYSLLSEVLKGNDISQYGRVYSHVRKSNTASLRTHQKAGFRIESDYAHYIDGSINRKCFTLVYEFEKNQNK